MILFPVGLASVTTTGSALAQNTLVRTAPQPLSQNVGNRCVVWASTDTVLPVSYNRKQYPGGSWWGLARNKHWSPIPLLTIAHSGKENC
jgi:hypothetical protein